MGTPSLLYARRWTNSLLRASGFSARVATGAFSPAYFCKCQISVNGSPRSEDDHAKYLRRKARRCRRRLRMYKYHT